MIEQHAFYCTACKHVEHVDQGGGTGWDDDEELFPYACADCAAISSIARRKAAICPVCTGTGLHPLDYDGANTCPACKAKSLMRGGCVEDWD